jgi:hypothetical protein
VWLRELGNEIDAMRCFARFAYLFSPFSLLIEHKRTSMASVLKKKMQLSFLAGFSLSLAHAEVQLKKLSLGEQKSLRKESFCLRFFFFIVSEAGRGELHRFSLITRAASVVGFGVRGALVVVRVFLIFLVLINFKAWLGGRDCSVRSLINDSN